MDGILHILHNSCGVRVDDDLSMSHVAAAGFFGPGGSDEALGGNSWNSPGLLLSGSFPPSLTFTVAAGVLHESAASRAQGRKSSLLPPQGRRLCWLAEKAEETYVVDLVV